MVCWIDDPCGMTVIVMEQHMDRLRAIPENGTDDLSSITRSDVLNHHDLRVR